MKEFVEVEELGNILLQYIGSEEFDRAVSGLEGVEKNAFIAGIGMAGCLIMGRCTKYRAETTEGEKEDE